ncbi:uncharacterized protein LOC126690085 [Quercus robur]|uniref:uncharacterized protein LOC126690085 n=1 Tax=Quercus robur TaxID=38942 RepID=UPI002163F0E4|nr:uncharacterized protein LOC126690085 [Quercus robur]
MSKPEVDEVLFTYITVASHAVSLVLVRVDSGVQRPVYYVSKLLHEAEKVYVDSVANHRESGVRLVLISPEKIVIEKSLRLDFSATNNEAEYEALLVGMTMVQKIGGKAVEIFSDSRLVVGQVRGELEARDLRMQEYLNQVILVEDLCKPTEVWRNVTHIHQIMVGPNWMDSILSFLKEDVLLEEKSEANKQLSYSWKNYMKGFVEATQGQIFVSQGPHSRLLVAKYAEGSTRGFDIVGPFPRAIGNKRYLLVSTDYFTKWVETEPLANIRDVNAKKFVWKNIVTRFGIPCTLISNNKLQFNSKAFRRYCCDLGIMNRYSTPAYPQGNG